MLLRHMLPGQMSQCLEVPEKFVVGWVAQAMWDRLHRLCSGVVVQAKFRVQL